MDGEIECMFLRPGRIAEGGRGVAAESGVCAEDEENFADVCLNHQSVGIIGCLRAQEGCIDDTGWLGLQRAGCNAGE